MFASFKAENVCRGTQVLVAESPLGPFQPHSIGPLTPTDWECLDGTFFLDDEHNPWLVFCHEWLQIHTGTICAQRLSHDLRHTQGAPVLLFSATDAAWVAPVSLSTFSGFVTDGPFFYRTRTGRLLLLWSSFSAQGYALALAYSASGKLAGPWQQSSQPLCEGDGGHGMLFSTFAGQLMLTLHAPNSHPHERPLFLPVEERDEQLHLL